MRGQGKKFWGISITGMLVAVVAAIGIFTVSLVQPEPAAAHMVTCMDSPSGYNQSRGSIVFYGRTSCDAHMAEMDVTARIQQKQWWGGWRTVGIPTSDECFNCRMITTADWQSGFQPGTYRIWQEGCTTLAPSGHVHFPSETTCTDNYSSQFNVY